MRYVAAYLLAVLGGNENPSAADIKKILSSVGIDAEDDKLKKVISELNGKDIQELIAEGSKKLASMPAAGAATAPATSTAAAPAAVEDKKEEAKKEESESEDEDMGFGLFD